MCACVSVGLGVDGCAHVCVHNSWLVMLAIIAENSSPENESRDGHQQNELAILKTFVCVCIASNGLNFMQDLCVCVCVCLRVCVCVCVFVCVYM